MHHPSEGTRKIYVYCDAGFANRMNALIFGKFIAKKLNLELIIYWPTNNWFGASYQAIFSDTCNAVNKAIHQINFNQFDCIGVLHDEVPQSFLSSCDTRQISSFQNEESFFCYLDNCSNKDIFLHTVLIPHWISNISVGEILREITFDESIIDKVRSFIITMPQEGFYGLHLRRTDLVTGLDDQEVFSLVSSNPEAFFFICSDSSEAEKLACIHPNCKSYLKGAYVEKKVIGNPWNAPTVDDSGRKYFGNIMRGAQASIDAVIDFIILAHSTILGESSSTFHALAMKVNANARIFSIPVLPIIHACSFAESKKRFTRWAIDLRQALGIIEYYCSSKDPSKALELVFAALYSSRDDEWLQLATTCLNLLIAQQRFELAIPILSLLAAESHRPDLALTSKIQLAALLMIVGRTINAGSILDDCFGIASNAQIQANREIITKFFPDRLVDDTVAQPQ
jgi:hypothetical protein